ncbi:MAG: glycosyltransferase family 4 protein [Actinobacteria bacterium]|nr:glycosyltransferase family 4 protein [Actinomycetota bacterium]
MKILLWHGYLLTGTGSNLYTANLAREWRAMGHDVLVLCQDRAAASYGFIDAVGDFTPANDHFSVVDTGASRAPGRAVVARPDIGSILPVYVYDDYPGFSAKRFVDLSEGELERYTRSNIAALVTAIQRHEPDAIVTGHEVMGPYIAREACRATETEYVAKLHGSGLEYAVKLQQRYLHYATLGLGGAKVVTGGSRYMIKAASAVIPGWVERSAVVNPGADIDLFQPIPRNAANPPTVGYVGKFIRAKGVHNFFAALGLMDTRGLQAVVVGFGGYEAGLRALWTALQKGDRAEALKLAQGGEEEPLQDLIEFLESLDDDAAFFGRIAGIRLEWLGRLDHEPLAKVLPGWDLLVVPSVVPEAFGMVAAEAAACGVLPVVPRHSGIGEIGATLEAELGVSGLVTFDPGDPIVDQARTVQRLLSMPEGELSNIKVAVTDVARRLWSWRQTATRLLELACRNS